MARRPHRDTTHRRPRRHRLGAWIVAPLVFSIALATMGLVEAPPAFALNDNEQMFVNDINGLRASLGLRQLTVDPQLSGIAHQHDLDMAAAGRLFHSSNLAAGITSPWTALAENIGMRTSGGPDLWQAFLHSPSHYANIVNPAFTNLGIGDDVVNGVEWTTQRFMAVGSSAPPAVNRAPVVQQYVAPAPTAPRSTTTRPATTTTAGPPPSATSTSSTAPDPTEPPPAPPPVVPQADASHVAAVVAVLQVIRQ
jgi:hypothetical protein